MSDTERTRKRSSNLWRKLGQQDPARNVDAVWVEPDSPDYGEWFPDQRRVMVKDPKDVYTMSHELGHAQGYLHNEQPQDESSPRRSRHRPYIMDKETLKAGHPKERLKQQIRLLRSMGVGDSDAEREELLTATAVANQVTTEHPKERGVVDKARKLKYVQKWDEKGNPK